MLIKQRSGRVYTALEVMGRIEYSWKLSVAKNSSPRGSSLAFGLVTLGLNLFKHDGVDKTLILRRRFCITSLLYKSLNISLIQDIIHTAFDRRGAAVDGDYFAIDCVDVGVSSK